MSEPKTPKATSDFHYADLTAEEIVKTPFKGTDDANQNKALDWVVVWATKKDLQLVFISVVSAEEEEDDYIHVKAIYTKNIK
jgi:hypothetical protein